jgi:hypothetical protein
MDSSYQDMINRIKNELQRNDSDIDDIVTHAISDSIRHFKDEVFAVNQASYYMEANKFDITDNSFKKSDGRMHNPLFGAMLDLPVDFSEMINMQVVKSATNYVMEHIPYSDLDNMDAKYDNPITGTPQYYSFLGEYSGEYKRKSDPQGPARDDDQSGVRKGGSFYTPGKIRIFPRPDNDYTLALRYVSNLIDPAEMTGAFTGRYGFWMNEAARMIKCYAKGVIYSDYLQQFDMAQAQESLAESEYNRLVMRSESRGFSDTVKAYL